MTMAVAAAIDTTRCPLCGASNRCAMEIERETGQTQPPCWCMQADFSNAPLSALPEAMRGLACLCARCAAGVPAAQD